MGSLRQTLKDLKRHLVAKNSEIGLLARNLKNTKHGELEVEIQSYIDECTRLRHHLEEFVKQRETLLNNELNSKKQQLLKQLKRTQEETAHWKNRFIELDNRKKKNPKNEAHKPKALLEAKARIAVTAQKQYQGESSKLILQLSLKENTLKTRENDIKENDLKIAHLREDLSRLRTRSRAPQAELQDLFRHLTMRLQLHRVAKAELLPALFSPGVLQYSLDEVRELFIKSPLSFTATEASALAAFVSESTDFSSVEMCLRITENTEDWELLAVSDEERFDKELFLLISENKEALIKACGLCDNNGIGVITVNELKQVLEDLKLEFSERLLHYVSLLFYSHSYALDKVPYKKFIKAYSEQNNLEGDSSEDSDEEKLARVVRGHLRTIAEALNKNEFTVREVFKCDRQGLITAQEFVHGLKRIELARNGRETEELVILMLEALQCEKEEGKKCILLEEFEEVLEHYGVPREGQRAEEGSDKGTVIVKNDSEYENESFASV